MGELYIHALCYDELPPEEAQKLWEERGGKGIFVPGMVAKPSVQISEPDWFVLPACKKLGGW